MIKVNNFKDLFNKLDGDIIYALDNSAKKLINYSEDEISAAYRDRCTWPLKDSDGNVIPNPTTGEPFMPKYNPGQLIERLKSSIVKDKFIRIAKIWVDLEGHKNAEIYETMGRLLEVYGCRPWGKLKSKFRATNGIKDAIK